jgi:hypothetical protein
MAAVLLVITLDCAGRQTYMVPPRIDLKEHEMIDLARQDQGLVRMVGFGSEDDALRSVAGAGLSPETFKALGREHGVRTILTGELIVSDIRPDLSLAPSLRSGSLSARVQATLAVELIETSTGASIWSTSSSATQSVGHISVFKGGSFVFDAEDPEEAYGDLVNTLVAQATRDFRVTRERR